MSDYLAEMNDRGFCLQEGPFETPEVAFSAAQTLIDLIRTVGGVGPLTVIGDFVIPPANGRGSRDFQPLHFDFGLPLDPTTPQDIARYTALYILPDAAKVTAITRLVPLARLLGQRSWPRRSELISNFGTYGRSHGAWDDSRGYVEGSFARIVEAGTADPPALPSVKADPVFLCGLEFDSLGSELSFFLRHGLDVERVEVDVALQPGQLLVFDNLAMAHGRRGDRQPGELHQRMFGHTNLSPAKQSALREVLLDAFHALPAEEPAPSAAVSVP